MKPRNQKRVEKVETAPVTAPMADVQRPVLIGAGILAALTLLMFADTLFSASMIPSQKDEADLWLQFAFWRAFGFGELRHGNLALWNPYLNSGTPHFGDFQSALLYPPNWIYMFLRLATAVNLDLIVHTWLLGFFMYLLALRRGLHWIAALLSSVLLMFCGAAFLHVRAGHLSLCCAAAWAPLILLIVSEICKSRTPVWVLLGIAAVAMQIYAGHPQTVFYTEIAAGLLFAVSFFRLKGIRNRLIALGSFAAIYAGAFLLAAVQLIVGAQAGAGSTRGAEGLRFEQAADFSFPFENLLTLLCPWFFGNGPVSGMTMPLEYWGRQYFWEMNLFFGAFGLWLAIYGAVAGERDKRRWLALIAALLLLLAFGGHTPLSRILYSVVPGFSRFRGSSKFIFEASIFLCLLAGVGMDRLLRIEKLHARIWMMVASSACLVFLMGVVVYAAASSGPSGFWGRLMLDIFQTRESYLSPDRYRDAEFIRDAGIYAARGLWICAPTLLLLAGALYAHRFFRGAAIGIAVLATFEVFVFARLNRPKFDLNRIYAPDYLVKFRETHPGDFRIRFVGGNENMGMAVGLESISGYNPQIGRRYSDFLKFMSDPSVDNDARLKLCALVRAQYFLVKTETGMDVQQLPDPMPHVQLVGNYSVIEEPRKILSAMAAPQCDLRRQVILESSLGISATQTADLGEAKIVHASTDRLEIEAAVKEPCILLMTDGYDPGWRARALEGSAQKEYRLIPADYVLRGIPLSAGEHHIAVEFVPSGFALGKWITIFSVVAFVGINLLLVLRRKASKVQRITKAS